MYERVGSYYYIFPTYAQARKVVWDGMDRDGVKFMDHLPVVLRKRTDSQQMLVEMNNGSIFQLVGSDEIDRLMGVNPVGCVFSEYALQNPAAWDYIRPILAENNGWAVFISTPRGKNHLYDLLELARAFPDLWYSEILSAEDTGAIDREVLEQERQEIVMKNGNDSLYLQEFICNFGVPIQGAYYATQLMKADDEKRICNIPIDDNALVHTAWDLGVDDSTAIWFFQVIGQEIHFIDCFESSGEGLNYYVQVLHERGYNYGTHYAPHDIQVRELSTGRSRLETAKNLGVEFLTVPRMSLEDGISAVRMILSRCWFDEKRCERGINALRSYHKEWDDENQVYRVRPCHDWSSHFADAMRSFAVGFKGEGKGRVFQRDIPVDPFG